MDMFNSSLQFIALKDEVLRIAGLEHITTADCRALSVLLFKKTKMHLSETTLKRIYGFAESKFAPSSFTKDVLAAFCGYRSWPQYTHEFLTRDHAHNAGPFSNSILQPQNNHLFRSFLDQSMIIVLLLSAIVD